MATIVDAGSTPATSTILIMIDGITLKARRMKLALDANRKLSLLITLWILDKLAMLAMFLWFM